MTVVFEEIGGRRAGSRLEPVIPYPMPQCDDQRGQRQCNTQPHADQGLNPTDLLSLSWIEDGNHRRR